VKDVAMTECCASVCLLRCIAVCRLVRLRTAAASVPSRRLTDNASMQTLSMLCASSKTTTQSRCSSRDTCAAQSC
jgi:hypothetical protein